MNKRLSYRSLAVIVAAAAGLFAVASLSSLSAAPQPPPILGSPQSFPIGAPLPFGISFPPGDLDGDGDVDLAVSTEGTGATPVTRRDGRMIVLLNDGNGAFTASTSLPLLTETEISAFPQATSIGRSVIIEDIDRDGRKDVLVADAGKPQSAPPGPPSLPGVPGWIVAYLNTGTGPSGPTFQRVISQVGERPLGMGLADFNEDGHLDIGINNENVDAAQILLGNGSGSFTVNQTIDLSGRSGNPLCDSAHFAAAADFTGDRKADLLVPCNNNGPIILLRGDGRGVVGGPQIIETGRAQGEASFPGSRPHTLALADFAQGRKQTPDFAVANTGVLEPNRSLSVFINQPAGKFTEERGSPYQVGTDPGARTSFVHPGQFAGNPDGTADAHPDLVITSGFPVPVDQRIALFVNTRRATGLFEHAPGSPYLVTPAGTDTVRELTVGDFNGDGQNDVAVILRLGRVAVLLHR